MIQVAVAFGFLAGPLSALAAEPDAGSDADASLGSGPTISPEPAAREGTDTSNPSREAPTFTTVVTGKQAPPLGTVSKIDANEISLRGARNVPAALALEPSVEVNQGPKAGATLQIRGFDERAILLMIEGIPIREVYDGHFDIASLPAFSLGSIEMERGVTSLLYGPNSAGGILSLHAPTVCDALADVSAFGGQLLYGGRLKACERISDFTLHVSAGYEHSDGYVLSDSYSQFKDSAQFHENGGVRDGSDYERASVALLAKYAPRPNKSVSLFLDGIHSPRGIPPFEGSGYVRFWRFTSYDTMLAGLSGVYGPEPDQLPLSWGFREVRGQVYAHVHRDEIRDYQDASYARLTTNPLAWFVASAYANETYGTALQSAWSLNEGNRLDTSLRYNLDIHRQREIPVPRNGMETDWTTWAHYSAQTYSAAVEDTQVLGSWRLNAGFGASGMSLLAEKIRDEAYPVDNRIIPAFEGRLVVEKALGEGFHLMAAAGHKVRYPTLKELFSNSAGGNPNLKSEHAWMAETGFDSNGIPFKDLDTSMRLFWNSIQDLIESYRQAYANVGRAVTAGVELEVRYKPVSFLQLLSGYRYLYARDLENDRPLDYRTPHRVMLGARLLTRFGLTCIVDATYNSGQQSYYADSLTGDWVHENLPSYVLVNGHIRYEHAVNTLIALYLFADGFNLLDTNYYVGSFEPRPGRELIFGIGGRV